MELWYDFDTLKGLNIKKKGRLLISCGGNSQNVNKRFNIINDQFLSEIERILLLLLLLLLFTSRHLLESINLCKLYERTDGDLWVLNYQTATSNKL